MKNVGMKWMMLRFSFRSYRIADGHGTCDTTWKIPDFQIFNFLSFFHYSK